ncbi:MAG: hypothetical protein ACHQX1_00025 [Candidatus Micrarchaeales archaeon]
MYPASRTRGLRSPEKISDEREVAIVLHWLRGETNNEMFEVLGEYRPTIIKCLRRQGLVPEKLQEPPKKQYKRLTHDLKMYIEADNLLLMTNSEIASELGVNRSTVSRYLKDRGIVPNLDPRRRINLQKEMELIELFGSNPGMTVTDAVEKVKGMTIVTASTILKRAGFEIRLRKELERERQLIIFDGLRRGLPVSEIKIRAKVSDPTVRSYDIAVQIDRAHLEEARRLLQMPFTD